MAELLKVRVFAVCSPSWRRNTY